MDKNEIEIPFGSNDSELVEATYHIPDGMEAIIEGDKVIIRKKESNNEKSNKAMLNACINALRTVGHSHLSDWLEKQSEKEPTKWSKEDERICQCIIRDQEKALDEVRNDKYGHSEIISDLKEMYRERIKWLESLKEKTGG